MDVLLKTLQGLLDDFGPQALSALAILVFGWLLAALLRRALRRVLLTAQADATLAGFAAHMLYFVLLALVVLSALTQLGVPTMSFFAVLGAAGLAVGLALKGLLTNFASGVLLIALRPFSVGDRIEAGGVTGVVAEIRIFTTVLKGDDKRIFVPNAAISAGNITNHSAA